MFMTRGCVHNVKEVDMMQRRQRRREPTTSIQSNVRGRDVTWRDVDGVMANPAKIFITIWFEGYMVVSQAWNFR
jgi:hypothetical protein